ncbi:MAG: twin-arginine translocase subunit TatC [Ilumatobacteraceae bacterium]
MKLPGGATTSDRPHPDDHMTLIEHLAELRMRLIRSVLAIVGGFIIVMALYRPILNFLSEPYNRICAQDASLNCENNGCSSPSLTEASRPACRCRFLRRGRWPCR